MASDVAHLHREPWSCTFSSREWHAQRAPRGQKNRISFPLNEHRTDSSAWSPYIHQERRNGIKILLEKVSHLSNPLFQKGLERNSTKGFQFLKTGLPLISRCSVVWQVYCWLQKETAWCIFLTFILKHTNTCSQSDICACVLQAPGQR